MGKISKISFYKKLYHATFFLRLIVPFFIFTYPLWTIFIASFLDLYDGEVASKRVLTHSQYQIYDKILDLWWYTLVFFYVLVNFPQHALFFLTLYFYRLIGESFFFFFRKREVLFFFPNLFENAFLLLYFYNLLVGINIFDSDLLYAYLSIAFFIKLFQEYLIHIKKITFSEKLFGIKKNWAEV